MSIRNTQELEGMQKISDVVAYTLKEMVQFTRPGISTKAIDDFGANILRQFGAQSAPFATYKFPGWTCISLGKEFCHGIPSYNKIIQEGDLINIDVSAELNGFWSDNGCSFVVGEDTNNHLPLVNASKEILKKAIGAIKNGVRISDVGGLIEREARSKGFNVIRNLTGHGIGKSLHEEPSEIVNYYDPYNFKKFKTNQVVAIETFISTDSNLAKTLKDGWTMVGNKGGFMAQHEHTIIVTDNEPIVLTAKNEIWN